MDGEVNTVVFAVIYVVSLWFVGASVGILVKNIDEEVVSDDVEPIILIDVEELDVMFFNNETVAKVFVGKMLVKTSLVNNVKVGFFVVVNFFVIVRLVVVIRFLEVALFFVVVRFVVVVLFLYVVRFFVVVRFMVVFLVVVLVVVFKLLVAS